MNAQGRLWSALLADTLVVVVFAAVGRLTHDEVDGIGGVFRTAWPFLAGLFLGWSIGIRRLPDPRLTQFAILVWGSTLFVGMGLRAFTVGTPEVSFVIVAALVLGALFIGWRVVAGRGGRQSAS
ncbi:MAG: DUF3054 domain-containing protein [Nocardioides sp.]